MQKLKLLGICIYLITLVQSNACAQSTSVQTPIPFRVGDKFGLTDQGGKFIIQPQFDWIETSDFKQKVLTGYIIKNGVVFSTLIYQNKVLLSNQVYRDYILRNGLFVATRYKITDENNREFNKRFIKHEDVFTPDGKKLIAGNYSDIAIMDGIDREGALDQTLVLTTDTAKRYSLFIYDRKLKTISKKYIVNSDYLRVINNSERYYLNKSYTIFYRDAQNAGHQLQITNNGKALVLTSDKLATIPPEPHYDGVRTLDIELPTRPFKSDTNRVHDSVSRVVNTYGVKRRFYFYPESIEQLENSISLLNGEELVTRNGKRGLRDENKGTMIIPTEYDDICKGDFENGNGYVLRKGKTYRAAYYNFKLIIFPTIFTRIPLVVVDYFGKDSPLIKLYDQDGRFFCYANVTGSLYYREK